MRDLVNILFLGLADASILALVTMGIVLIYKTSFTTNFAQGSIATVSAYTVTAVFDLLIKTNLPQLPAWLGVSFSVLIGVVVGATFGIVIDTLIIRKSKFSNPISKQMITMGVIMFISGLIAVVFGGLNMETRTPTPLVRETFTLRFGAESITLSWHSLLVIVIAFIVLTAIFLALKFTKWGIGVRATASNERVAGMMGINTKRITAMSWGIAGGLGALAAGLYGPMIFTLGPDMMVGMQVNGFLAGVLGGFSTFGGPIFAAVLMTFTKVILQDQLFGVNIRLFGSQIDQWVVAFIYLLLLIVILFKPLGLFGKKIAKKV
jgi:branched-chain amino acid transport system permease protein